MTKPSKGTVLAYLREAGTDHVMNLKTRYFIRRVRAGQLAFSLLEVMIAVLIVGVLTVALYASFSHGFSTIQTARENLRATQILVKRMETIRLYTWSQLLDTNNYLKPTFQEPYDPYSAVPGLRYAGTVQASIPTDLPTAYRTNMRTVTVSVYWTNGSSARPVVHSRQMQTRVGRNGMQNYVYGNR